MDPSTGNVGNSLTDNITGNQTTQYVYGTSLSDSGIASSLLKRAEIYPDSDDTYSVGEDGAPVFSNGADETYDRIEFKYNRLGEVTEIKDQSETVHAFDYDALGRQTQDRVTTLGTGVDGAVRRIASTFEVRGMREKITSYDNATVGTYPNLVAMTLVSGSLSCPSVEQAMSITSLGISPLYQPCTVL